MLIFCFHQHLENQRPKLWGVGNLKFFHMIDIYEMAAIFQFFHNGQHWYSFDTQRTGDINFPFIQFSKFSIGSVFPITNSRFHFNINVWLRLKKLCMDIYTWWPFCTQKIGDVIFLLIQFSKFSFGSVFPITHPRFSFNIYAWLHLKHLCVVSFLQVQPAGRALTSDWSSNIFIMIV